MKFVIGVDPGLQGGIAIVGKFGRERGALAEPMPVTGGSIDPQRIKRFLEFHLENVGVAYVELVHSMPKQGVKSTFTFGEGFGLVKGTLLAMGIPIIQVRPQQWMKEMHQGIDPALNSKDRSRLAALNLFPMLDLRKSERSRIPHDGMCEALLIAEYGRRQEYERGRGKVLHRVQEIS